MAASFSDYPSDRDMLAALGQQRNFAQQQFMYGRQAQQGLGGLGSLLLSESLRAEPAKPQPKTLRQELQSEVTEWIKDV